MTAPQARTRRPPAITLLVAAIPAVLIVAAAALGAGRGAAREPLETSPTPSVERSTIGAGPWTLAGAGDIAHCDGDGDEHTARLLESIGGAVFTAGDNAYPHGTARDFADCYGPSWGRLLDRTHPALGTHEYDNGDADAYFEYFGGSAGPKGRGYYSYAVGSWQVIVLNTNCRHVPGGCERRSPQVLWLRDELIGAGALCTVVVSGHPRFSSGFHGDDRTLRHLFDVLHDERVELLVSGHDHNYERLAPLDPEGYVDRDRGVRQFVVGTGGRGLRAVAEPRTGSEVVISDSFGVLRLRLYPDRYEWAFIATDERTLDGGGDNCH